MNTKIFQLLKRLFDQTTLDKVDWEYFSDESSIRTLIGKGLVRIRKNEFPEYYSLDGAEVPTGDSEVQFTIILIDEKGRHTDTIVLEHGSQEEKIARMLYEQVSSRTREKKTGKLLDEMLIALGK